LFAVLPVCQVLWIFVMQSTWNAIWRWDIQTNHGIFWRVPKQAACSTIRVKNVSSKWYVCLYFCSCV